MATLQDRVKAADAAPPPTFFTAEQACLWHAQLLICKQAGGHVGQDESSSCLRVLPAVLGPDQ